MGRMGYAREFGRMISWLGPPKVKPNPRKIYANSVNSYVEEQSWFKDIWDTVACLLYLFCGYALVATLLFGLWHFCKFLLRHC